MTGKFYIGLTRGTIANRWSHHKWESRTSRTLFHNALRKYGAASDDIALKDRERYWIETLSATDRDVGYNISPGGDGGGVRGRRGPEHHMWGRTHTDEAKAKISAAGKRTWVERLGEEGAAAHRALHQARVGVLSAKYKAIDGVALLRYLIEHPKANMDAIANEFGMSRPTAALRFNEIVGVTSRSLRSKRSTEELIMIYQAKLDQMQ